MKAGVALIAVTLGLAFAGTASAEHRGVAFGFGFVRLDYHHRHALPCGCRVECHYYRGAHHYSRHRHVDRHDDHHAGYDDYRYRDRDYDYDDYGYGSYGYRDDRYRHERYGYDRYRYDGYRRDYWHRHYLNPWYSARCHVVGGVHYYRR
jgi:hypothetical protein